VGKIRSKPFIPKWLWVLFIPAGATLLAAIFGMFGHGKASNHTITGTNNHSVSVAGNQKGNNTIDDHSTTAPQTISVAQSQAPIFNAQNSPINIYYGAVSNSITKDAF